MKEEYKKTEIGKIPVEWKVEDFKNIFYNITHKPYQIQTNEYYKAGNFEVVDQGKNKIVGYNNNKERLFENVPIIIFGDHTTIIKYREKPFIIGGDGVKLLKINDNYNIKFMYYNLCFYNIKTDGYKRHFSILKEIKLSIPLLKEQEKIANILSIVDENIENVDNLIIKTKKLKKGLMQELLTKGIGHTEYKETEIGKIPLDWTVENVEKLTLDNKQGFYTNQEYSSDGEYNLVRITDLNNPKIDFSAMPKISVPKNIFEQYYLKKNDFLFARSGAIGRYGIYDNIEKNSMFASYLIRFRFDNNYLNTSYFGFLYQSLLVAKQLKKIIQGSSNININAQNIKSLLIPIPPIKEQEKIVSILSSLDSQIEQYEDKKIKLEELKKGLMQKLLTGEIRLKI